MSQLELAAGNRACELDSRQTRKLRLGQRTHG
jgi:Flp pilus assembly pilin Flp